MTKIDELGLGWPFRAAVVALVIEVGACSFTPDPVFEDVRALTWNLSSHGEFKALRRAAIETAADFDAQVTEQGPDRVLVTSPQFVAGDIDQHCRYPVINSKTGGRMHTFSSWQFEKWRSRAERVTGVVLIEIRRDPNGIVTVASNCRGDTMLGRHEAATLGVWEKSFFEVMRDKLKHAP